MVGRALRPAAGKTDAIVIDHSGAVQFAPAPGVVVNFVGSGMVLAIDDRRRRLDGEVQTPGLRSSRTKAN
jgi:hypothetical protein